ncbi:MAG: hypothetical protein GY861_11525 [bacterium]|nr:hypothetical protein [bacterium]
MSPLLQEIASDRGRIQELLLEIKKTKHTTFNAQESIMEGIAESINSMIWSKEDVECRFVLANSMHCSTFFGFTNKVTCLKQVHRQAYTKLMDKTPEIATNELCISCSLSDEYVRMEGGVHHFIEAACINKEDKLLYVMKTGEQNKEGEFLGISGIAWDITESAHLVMPLLNKLIQDHKAIRVYKGDDILSYVIVPHKGDSDIFKTIMPVSKIRLGKEELTNYG